MQPQGRLSTLAFSWTNEKGDPIKRRMPIQSGEAVGELRRSYLDEKINQFLGQCPEVEFPLVVTNDGRCSQDLRDPGLLLETDPQGRTLHDRLAEIKLVTCRPRTKILRQIDDMERWFCSEMTELRREMQQNQQKIYTIAVLYGDPIYDLDQQEKFFYDKLDNTVSYEHEIRKIIDKIKRIKKNILLKSMPATLKNLRKLLEDREEVYFLHLCLHGQKSPAELKFECQDKFGKCKKVKPEQLSSAIKKYRRTKLKIIFLMACYSGKFFQSLKRQTNMIVGISENQKMQNYAAEIFSSEFYEKILCRHTYLECWEGAIKSVDQVYRGCFCAQNNGYVATFGNCKNQHEPGCGCKDNIHSEECVSRKPPKSTLRFFQRLTAPKTYWCCCCNFDHEHSKKFIYWLELGKQKEVVLEDCKVVADEEVEVGDYMNVPPLKGTYEVHFKTMHEFCRLMVEEQPLRRLFLVGQHGCGKTSFIKRLAQYIMARSHIKFKKIICLNLAKYKHTIKMLTHAEIPGLAQTFNEIKEEVKKQDCFFILDNCEGLISLDFEGFKRIVNKIELTENSKLIVIANEPVKPEYYNLFQDSRSKQQLVLSLDIQKRFVSKKIQRKNTNFSKWDMNPAKISKWCSQSIIQLNELSLPESAQTDFIGYVDEQLSKRQDNTNWLRRALSDLKLDQLDNFLIKSAAKESEQNVASILDNIIEDDVEKLIGKVQSSIDKQILYEFASNNDHSRAIHKIIDIMWFAIQGNVDLNKQLEIQESMIIIPQLPSIKKLQFQRPSQKVVDKIEALKDHQILVRLLRDCLRTLATIRKKIYNLPKLQSKKFSNVVVWSVAASCRLHCLTEDMCYEALAALQLIKQQQQTDYKKGRVQVMFSLMTFYKNKKTLQAIRHETQRMKISQLQLQYKYLQLQFNYRVIESKGVDETKKADLRNLFNHLKAVVVEQKCPLFVLACLKLIFQNPECCNLLNDKEFKEVVQKIRREKEKEPEKSDQIQILVLYLRYYMLKYETKSYEDSQYKDIIGRLEQIQNPGELGKKLDDMITRESKELEHCRIKVLVAEHHHQDSFPRRDDPWFRRSLEAIKTSRQRRGAIISSYLLTRTNLNKVLEDDCLLLALKCSLKEDQNTIYIKQGKSACDIKTTTIKQFVEQHSFSRARIILLCGKNVQRLGQRLNQYYHGHVIVLELKDPKWQVMSTLQVTRHFTIQQNFCEQFLTSFIKGLLDQKYNGVEYAEIVDEVWILSRYESLMSIVALADKDMRHIEQKCFTLHKPSTYTGFQQKMPITTKFNDQLQINPINFGKSFTCFEKWEFVKYFKNQLCGQKPGLVIVDGQTREQQLAICHEVAYIMKIMGVQHFEQADNLSTVSQQTKKLVLYNPEQSSKQEIERKSRCCVILLPLTKEIEDMCQEKKGKIDGKNDYFEKCAAMEVCRSERHISCDEVTFRNVVKNSGRDLKSFIDRIKEASNPTVPKGKQKKGRQ